MVNRFSRFAAYHPKQIIAVALILIIPSLIGIAKTKVNYDLLSYLPKELDSVKGEKILDEVFESAGSALLIVENMPSKDVLKIKNEILTVDGVKDIIWIDSFVDISVPHEILPDAVNRIFYSADGNSTLMMIRFEGQAASESTMIAVESIKSIMNNQCFLSGMSVLLSDTKEVVENEALQYVVAALIGAFAVLAFTLNSIILPIIIIVSLGISVLYNMGTNFFGEISYITQSIAAILQLGVTMDYSVFLSDRYSEELKTVGNKNEAMSNAITKTFFSLSGSALTTVLGFLAMCFMSFSIGADIGIVMSKGVVFGALSALLLLPSIILVFFNPQKNIKKKFFAPDLGKISVISVKHKKTVTVIFVLLIAVSYIIKNNVNVYYDLIKALPQEITSVTSLEKLRNEFEMSTSYFVIYRDSVDPLNSGKMSAEFENTDGVSSVLSLETVTGPAIPADIVPDAIIDLCLKDGYRLMMVNSEYASASAESALQMEKLTEILKKYDDGGFVTGEAALSKDLAQVTAKDFGITGFISVFAVFCVIAILFKSIRLPIIIVLSIELAVFINEALPYFTGEDVPFIAPTVIGCVQLGATVDYAILMTTRFLEELKNGKTKLRAIKSAFSLSGKSVIQSALVLFAATFSVYIICDVILVKSICLMLARGAIISAAVILLFLPALLYLFGESTKINRVKVND